MKKILLLLVLLLSAHSYVVAQSYTEVVYLKNGSVIKGTIIEQIPNVSLKVQTAEGDLIICQMDDVEKITKEERDTSNYRSDYNNRSERRAARRTLRGYKGFAEAGFLWGANDDNDYYNGDNIGISTSHGYQFNNYFFLGAGAAAHFYTNDDMVSIPLFIDFRANFINKKVTPFADIKIGHSVGDINGVYAAMGFGIRFALKGKQAINLKLEFNYQEDGDNYSDWYDDHDYNWYENNPYGINGFGLKVGFEF